MKEITISDLPEIPVWKKRDAFMSLFFEIHEARKLDTTLVTIISSYHLSELQWVKIYGGKAYESDESFLRTYYYYLNEKHPKPSKPITQYSLF